MESARGKGRVCLVIMNALGLFFVKGQSLFTLAPCHVLCHTSFVEGEMGSSSEFLLFLVWLFTVLRIFLQLLKLESALRKYHR